jgi:putative addiction module killer protein
MFEVRTTAIFDAWISSLRDKKGKSIVIRRVSAIELGHFGDIAPVGKGVSEMRIHFGPGYRVYLTRRGKQVVILLCGGDKGSQKRDIARALELAELF